MDADYPLRRRLSSFGLLAGLAIAGCQSPAGVPVPTTSALPRTAAPGDRVPSVLPGAARGQAPGAPTPGYPVGPDVPPSVVPSVLPDSPVEGRQVETPLDLPVGGPLAPGPAAPAVQKVGYSGPGPNPAPVPFVPEGKAQVKVVATIGKGNIVTDDEVWQAVRQRPDFAALPSHAREDREREMYRYQLKKIIERELLIDEMMTKLKKNKPGAIDDIKDYAAKSADRQLRGARKRYELHTESEFQEKVLTPQGLTVTVIRRQMERDTICGQYISGIVKEKGKSIGLGDIHEFYVRYPDKFKTEDRVKWLDIFVASVKYPTPEEAFRQAESIRQRAAAGADFMDLLKYDQGDAAFRNGAGVGQRRGEILPADLEPTIFQLQAGQVSGLVQVPAGYHVVKVVERENAGIRPFDDKVQAAIRTMLIAQMEQQEYTRTVDDLWRKGAVHIVDVP